MKRILLIFIITLSLSAGVVDEIRENYNKSMSYYEKGDYKNASISMERALRLPIDNYGDNDETAATLYNNVGFFYSNIGDYQMAIEYHNKALYI